MKTEPSPHPLLKTYGLPSPQAAITARDDAELVRRFVAGDEAAFVAIVQRYEKIIFNVAMNFLRNAADAEEVAQETFIRAYRSLPRFRGDSSLATWLNRIASNLAKNRYWYFFRRRRHLSISLDRPIGEEGDARLADLFSNGEATPAESTCCREFSELVNHCMQGLQPHHREILGMRNSQHLAYDEIARRLGVSEGTVKSRIARARDGLRRLMAQACPEFQIDAQPADWLEHRRPDPVSRL